MQKLTNVVNAAGIIAANTPANLHQYIPNFFVADHDYRPTNEMELVGAFMLWCKDDGIFDPDLSAFVHAG